MNIQPEILLLPDGRMDTKNASIYLGLSTKTLAMMRCAGKGPQFVKRGKIFYFKTDLDDWIDQGRAGSTAQANLVPNQSCIKESPTNDQVGIKAISKPNPPIG